MGMFKTQGHILHDGWATPPPFACVEASMESFEVQRQGCHWRNSDRKNQRIETGREPDQLMAFMFCSPLPARASKKSWGMIVDRHCRFLVFIAGIRTYCAGLIFSSLAEPHLVFFGRGLLVGWNKKHIDMTWIVGGEGTVVVDCGMGHWYLFQQFHNLCAAFLAWEFKRVRLCPHRFCSHRIRFVGTLLFIMEEPCTPFCLCLRRFHVRSASRMLIRESPPSSCP